MALDTSADDLTPEDLAPDAPNDAIDAVSTEGLEDGSPAVLADVVEEDLSGVEGEQVPEDVEAAPETDEEVAESEKPLKKKTAEDRIQQLVAEKNQLTEYVQRQQAEYTRYVAGLQAQAQKQAQAQMAQLAEQNQILQDRLSAVLDRRESEDLEKLPLSEQIERRAHKRSLSDAERLIDQKVNERVGRVEQELQKERELRAEAEETWKRERRLQKLNAEVDKGVGSLLEDVDTAGWSDSDRDVLESMFIGYAGGKGKYPHEAAPDFRRVLDKWAAGRFRSKSAQSKQQIQKSRSVPSVGAAAKKSAAASKGATTVRHAPPDNIARDPEALFEFFAKQEFAG